MDNIKEKLKHCFEVVLNKTIEEDENFFNEGFDSLVTIYFTEVINGEFGVEDLLKPEEVYENPTINKLAQYIFIKFRKEGCENGRAN